MNAYCKQIGKNVTFQFQIEDAEGEASTHLDKVKNSKIKVSRFLLADYGHPKQVVP